MFSSRRFGGNALAVVLDGEGLSSEEMQTFAGWTNLSETTFLLAPTDPAADYRVRIFTPTAELPFAGHPTIGSAHAWLEAGGQPQGDELIQQCGAGLIRLRDGRRLAFGAPPAAIHLAPPEAVTAVADALGIDELAIEQSAVLTCGPTFLSLVLDSAERVLAIEPDHGALAATGWEVGIVGRYPLGSASGGDGPDVEVRALLAALGIAEDPVTGSLHAALAQWLIPSGALPERYLASQGTRLGRQGEVHVERDVHGQVWIGGDVTTVIAGEFR